jgi:fructose-specific phosphotransferase system IIC component
LPAGKYRTGLIGGTPASSIGAGFPGGIIAGFIGRHASDLTNKHIKLPPNPGSFLCWLAR